MVSMRSAVALLVLAATFSSPAQAQSALWTKRVVSLVAEAQNYPKVALARKEQGTAKVRVKLDDTGGVTLVEIAQSSGSAALDAEAQAMIKKIGSFPAPPAGATTLVIPITWVLN